MTYGFGYQADELEKAFDLVERALREQGVTRVNLEYSEGVEVSGPRNTSTRASLYHAWRRGRR